MNIYFFFSKNKHCDLDLSPRLLKLELVQNIVILNNDVKLIKTGPKRMTIFFSKKKKTLALISTLKCLTSNEFFQDIVIINICVRLNEIQSINGGASG